MAGLVGVDDRVEGVVAAQGGDVGGVTGAAIGASGFATIDQTGIGQLVEIAVTKGRQTRPDIKLGICGEHGGDPLSVHFFDRIGLDYVSCSPFRVPIARLSAAHAILNGEQET